MGEMPTEAQALQTPGPTSLLTHFTFPLTKPKLSLLKLQSLVLARVCELSDFARLMREEV